MNTKQFIILLIFCTFLGALGVLLYNLGYKNGKLSQQQQGSPFKPLPVSVDTQKIITEARKGWVPVSEVIRLKKLLKSQKPDTIIAYVSVPDTAEELLEVYEANDVVELQKDSVYVKLGFDAKFYPKFSLFLHDFYVIEARCEQFVTLPGTKPPAYKSSRFNIIGGLSIFPFVPYVGVEHLYKFNKIEFRSKILFERRELWKTSVVPLEISVPLTK